MNKIIEGAKQALSFVRGEGSAARIHATVGGPYIKDRPNCGLIQHKVHDGYIVWNWDTASWDRVVEPVQVCGADR